MLETRPRYAGAEDLLAEYRPSLYELLVQFYSDYAEAATSGLEKWPEFFTDDIDYSATSLENVRQGWETPLLRCRGRRMAVDQANAILRTAVFRPRVTRYHVSGVRITGVDGNVVSVRAEFLVAETIGDAETQLTMSGTYEDEVVVEPSGRMLFRRRRVVYDSPVVQTALIYPL